MFLVILPDTPMRDGVESSQIDWDFAQNELYLRKESAEREII